MNAINQYIAKFSRTIFFIVVALIVCSHPSFCEGSAIGVNEDATDEQYESYIKEFQNVFRKEMEREFNLTWTGGDFPHRFSPHSIIFYTYRRATLEEARALELSVLNRLAEKIRADPNMLSYLNRKSLSVESIGVDIHFAYLYHWSYYDGSIESIYSSYSKRDKKRYLQYTTTDPFSDSSALDYKAFGTRFDESYEDAVKLNATISTVNTAIHQPTEFEDELNQILTSFEKKMKEKHGLRFQSSGWMSAGKATSDISEIRAKCMYLYPVDCQEARALMLLATEELLSSLNTSATLRPYLKEYPFTASRLKLRMLFQKEKFLVGYVHYYDGSMESAVLNENVITYYHHIPSIKDPNLHDRVVYAKETYQEAQKAFENAPPQTLFEKISKWINKFTVNVGYFRNFAIFVILSALVFLISTNAWIWVILAIIIFIVLRRCRLSRVD
ncbi:MAG: hypothetical protein WCG42_09285 [Parachlamydiaceae bacterium]